ncbi:hypothetical protein ETX26_00005 [Pelagerythrobacter rhizovicinus]|uniref:Uncharacterized protein n=1 Tax=Pelagerythrobacter rhizovicinus TaxID=2268576 RepID=A0A4Q2KJ19_9SPHN|nr:hypothetical protein ETX26_00005 [Pelagerythrobacter rhizovicinus]
MIEFLIFRSFFLFIPAALLILLLLTLRCSNCGTAIYDHRIAPYVRGFDLEVLDKCPVCEERMLAHQQKTTDG